MPIKENGNNKCSVCGNENDGKNVYCGICGNELNPQNEDAEFEEQKDLVSPKGQLEDDDTFESEIAEQDTETANSGAGAGASSDEEIWIQQYVTNRICFDQWLHRQPDSAQHGSCPVQLSNRCLAREVIHRRYHTGVDTNVFDFGDHLYMGVSETRGCTKIK